MSVTLEDLCLDTGDLEALLYLQCKLVDMMVQCVNDDIDSAGHYYKMKNLN